VFVDLTVVPWFDNSWLQAMMAGAVSGPIIIGSALYLNRRMLPRRQRKALAKAVDLVWTAMGQGIEPDMAVIQAAYEAEASGKRLDASERATAHEIRNQLVRRTLKSSLTSEQKIDRLAMLNSAWIIEQAGPPRRTGFRDMLASGLGGVILGLTTVVLTGLASGAHFANGEVGNLSLGLAIAAGGFVIVALTAWLIGLRQ